MSITNLPNLAQEPPITSIGIINLAWSLILNISIEDRDIKLGNEVLNFWKEVYKRNEKANDITAIRYLDNISCSLFGFLESIAFERYFYYQYTHTFEEKRKNSIKYWNDLADLTSFSKDGIILRIVSFLGVGGGGASLLNHLFLTGNNSQLISMFLLSGFIGLVVLVVLVKRLRTTKIEDIVHTTLVVEENYWKKARRKYVKDLEHLFVNVQKIQELFYPGYSKTKNLSREEMVEVINKLLSYEGLFDSSENKKGSRSLVAKILVTLGLK
jgi:hypothetical protein